MKRKLIPILVMTILMSTPVTASAVTPNQEGDNSPLFSFEIKNPIFLVEPAVIEVEQPKPITHTVVSGENLTKIGSTYNVEWQRLWAKNTSIAHPDLINVGDKIIIPEPSEQLSRELPAVVALPSITPNAAPVRSYGGGNTYDYGYCTWYVKNRRGASLPNGLGNANTWYSRAAGLGMAVGRVPRVGAVGTTTSGALGHVVYVESVNSNGTVNISEMNYKGFGVKSSRTTSASEFVYIY